jgi:hypothetical protein
MPHGVGQAPGARCAPTPAGAASEGNGGVGEWLNPADCKSARLGVRWFESSPLHQASLTLKAVRFGREETRDVRGFARRVASPLASTIPISAPFRPAVSLGHLECPLQCERAEPVPYGRRPEHVARPARDFRAGRAEPEASLRGSDARRRRPRQWRTNDGQGSYAYDLLNRLTSSGAGAGAAYDATGRLASVSQAGSTRRFVGACPRAGEAGPGGRHAADAGAQRFGRHRAALPSCRWCGRSHPVV